jgi:hypothetical protein
MRAAKWRIHRCAKSHRVAAHYNLLQHVALGNVSRLRCSKVAIYEVPDGQIQQFKAECSIIGVECKVAQTVPAPDD